MANSFSADDAVVVERSSMTVVVKLCSIIALIAGFASIGIHSALSAIKPTEFTPVGVLVLSMFIYIFYISAGLLSMLAAKSRSPYCGFLFLTALVNGGSLMLSVLITSATAGDLFRKFPFETCPPSTLCDAWYALELTLWTLNLVSVFNFSLLTYYFMQRTCKVCCETDCSEDNSQDIELVVAKSNEPPSKVREALPKDAK